MEVPYLPYEVLRQKAEAFLDMYHPSRAIPIPIEQIVELRLRMNIVPVPDLERGFDTVPFLSRDMDDIYVDEYVSERNIGRYHFSLAHEVAHRILHESIYRSFAFNSIPEWRTLQAEIPPREYQYFETQANNFAGLVLVPACRLRESFDEARALAEKAGFSLSEIEEDAAVQYMAEWICRKYAVSAETVKIRIQRDSLLDSL